MIMQKVLAQGQPTSGKNTNVLNYPVRTGGCIDEENRRAVRNDQACLNIWWTHNILRGSLVKG
jgi:hypothetical protein